MSSTRKLLFPEQFCGAKATKNPQRGKPEGWAKSYHESPDSRSPAQLGSPLSNLYKLINLIWIN